MFLIERGYSLFLDAISSPWSMTGLTAGIVVISPAVVRYLPIFRRVAIRKTVFTIVLWAAGLAVPLIGLICFYLLRVLGDRLPQDLLLPAWNPFHYISGLDIVGLIAIGCTLFAVFLLNVNLTGPHKLYRDQLSKTFIHAPQDVEALPLSSINLGHHAPYHLINAIVNLPSSVSSHTQR